MKKVLVFLLAVTFMMFPLQGLLAGETSSSSVTERLKGRIVLQIESNGEAWYVNPADAKRYYLGKPSDAFSLMRTLSLGVSDKNLAKIPAYRSGSTGDQALVNRLKGRILLQTEQNGEAWYVSPVNGQRYYLGRPADAFLLMRNLGLGISNDDLSDVDTSTTDDSQTIRTGTANVELSASAQSDGVQLSWTKSNRGDNFQYYKVVRSTINDDPTYSEDGYIKAISDIDELTYTDDESQADQAYYYRVCVLYSAQAEGVASTTDGTSSRQEECSNVIQITAQTDSDTDTSLTAPTLSATADSDGVSLSWTENTESNFQYYKVVRSQTDSSPTYPEDGYIAVKGQEVTTYTDTEVCCSSSGTYYYRICAVNTSGSVYCGNVVTVVDGVVQ